MLMHLLAVPLGIVIFVAILFIVGLIFAFPKEILGIVMLIVIGYWLGANVLGLVS